MKKSAFDVYSTTSGLKQVSNPVRQKILSELQRKDLSLSEIANLTGKAQSTLSVHLDKMVNEGLVASKDDPSDNRRKIFYLISRPVGSSVVPREDLRRAVGQTISESVGTPSHFLKGMIRSIILGVESIGFSMDPVLKDIGRQIGRELSKQMKSESIEDLVEEVQEFYELHELGEVCVYSFLPLTIIVRDDYNCSGIPEASKTLCLLNEGILEAILETASGMPLKVTDTECFGTGQNYCKYVIEPEVY
ncbi:MAG: ArsR family transcriptional regulator [Methanomassiliicoccales archaeon]